MPLSLIQTIAPAMMGLALVIPILAGFLGRRLWLSIILGWVLFVAAFLFQDVLALLLANHFHGQDGVRAVAVEQPGTCAAVVGGWLLPLAGHFLGRGARALLKPFFGSHSQDSSE